VEISGKINTDSGIVVNIKDIDQILKKYINSEFDGSILDADIPEFKRLHPTPENIARAVWRRLLDKIPPGARLESVSIAPNPLHLACTTRKRLGNDIMHTTTRTYDFSASHRLNSDSLTAEENQALFGKCNRVNGHGHNYDVEVTVSGLPDDISGQLVDLDVLDVIVDEEVITPYDHRHLNYDVSDYQNLNPTSENVTKVIWDKLERRVNAIRPGKATLYRVAVRETPRNYFEYYGE
jgi:6-pyruvoyltetrahydropterin/6-carboxytetrahydropterin synthase